MQTVDHPLHRYKSLGFIFPLFCAAGTQQFSPTPRLRHSVARLQSAPVFAAQRKLGLISPTILFIVQSIEMSKIDWDIYIITSIEARLWRASMLYRIHDSTSNDSVSMMVLPKPAIFMTGSIMTESQHVNVHNYTKQDNSQ